MNTFDKDKHILKGPPVPIRPEPQNQLSSEVDAGLAYVQAMVKMPELLQNILEVLEDISNSLEISAVCSRRDAEDRNILKPDDIQDIESDTLTGPEIV